MAFLIGMVLASAVIGIGLYWTIKARKQKIKLAHSLIYVTRRTCQRSP